jgi:hypothetical protein
MRRSGTFSITIAGCLLLCGCGQNLGDYSLEKVEVARDLPTSFPKDAQSYGKYLAITLSSTTSLTALGDKVDGVYVDADFCPLRSPDRIVAFGPVSEDGEDLNLPSAVPGLNYTGMVATGIASI